MKAAWAAFASGIFGFYLAVAGAAVAHAQTPEQPPVGVALAPDILQALPASNSPFAILETIPTDVIADRFTAGGLNAGTPPRFGALLNSWNQTQYRIGDVSVTDPLGGGTPLVIPDLAWWPRLTIATAAMPIDSNASALSVVIDPQRPSKNWSSAVEGAFSASPLVSGVSGGIPAIDRVDQWLEGHALVSGPLTERLGLVAGATWLGLSHVPAPGPATADDRVASGFAQLAFATGPDEVRVLGLVQRASTAGVTDTSLHAQSTWERRPDPKDNVAYGAWRVFAGYTERSRSAPLPAIATIDTVNGDLASDLFDAGDSFARRWVVGARTTPSASTRLPAFGVDFEGAQARIEPGGVQQIDELVDGVPARWWTLSRSAAPDKRSATTLAAFVDEHLRYQRVTVEGGLRLDHTAASAGAAASGIQWTSWLPRALVRWTVFEKPWVTVLAGYRRSAYQIPLTMLAVGDPAAPVADVSRWTGSATGPLVARVGPGTGGDASFSQIDPNLERPTTDELLLAVESRPIRWLQFGAARVTKREPLMQFVDTGISASDYSSFQVPDVNFLPDSPVGHPTVTAFNRAAGLYGRDRYLLTNRTDDPARSWGIELSIRATTERFILLATGAFTWATGPAAAIGFAPTANDQDVLGSAFVDRNAATEARGQLFQDRSHTAKIVAIWRLPARTSVGAILRYQDGQPFARLVVVPNLNQGAMPVRSYFNGGSAFTYTGTLDVRVQKQFALNGRDAAVYVDVFNAPNVANEASERVTSGAAFRTPTSVQPPCTAVIGLRLTF